jgi:hypothetical protein
MMCGAVRQLCCVKQPQQNAHPTPAQATPPTYGVPARPRLPATKPSRAQVWVAHAVCKERVPWAHMHATAWAQPGSKRVWGPQPRDGAWHDVLVACHKQMRNEFLT